MEVNRHKKPVLRIMGSVVGGILLSLCAAEFATHLPVPLWPREWSISQPVWAAGCFFLSILPLAVLLLNQIHLPQSWDTLGTAAGLLLMSQAAALLWARLALLGRGMGRFAIWAVVLQMFLTAWNISVVHKLGRNEVWAASLVLLAIFPALWVSVQLWMPLY